MNRSHHELRIALGAYALGTLEPHEQRQVEAHLASCPACLDELDELLQPVPALASISGSDVAEPQPSADLYDRIAGAVARPAVEDPRPRRTGSARGVGC